MKFYGGNLAGLWIGRDEQVRQLMKYLIITKIPVRQGIFSFTPAKNILEEAEAPDIDALRNDLHIPIDGECLVIEMDNVVTIKSRVINEIKND